MGRNWENTAIMVNSEP